MEVCTTCTQPEGAMHSRVHNFTPGCLRGIKYLFAVTVYKNVGLRVSFKRKDYLEQGIAKTALWAYFEGGFKDAI